MLTLAFVITGGWWVGFGLNYSVLFLIATATVIDPTEWMLLKKIYSHVFIPIDPDFVGP